MCRVADATQLPRMLCLQALYMPDHSGCLSVCLQSFPSDFTLPQFGYTLHTPQTVLSHVIMNRLRNKIHLFPWLTVDSLAACVDHPPRLVRDTTDVFPLKSAAATVLTLIEMSQVSFLLQAILRTYHLIIWVLYTYISEVKSQ